MIFYEVLVGVLLLLSSTYKCVCFSWHSDKVGVFCENGFLNVFPVVRLPDIEMEELSFEIGFEKIYFYSSGDVMFCFSFYFAIEL